MLGNWKNWNKKNMTPVVIDAVATVTKGLVQGLEELGEEDKLWPSKLEDCQDRAKYWGYFWWLDQTCHLWNSTRKPSATAAENSQKSNDKKQLKT